MYSCFFDYKNNQNVNCLISSITEYFISLLEASAMYIVTYKFDQQIDNCCKIITLKLQKKNSKYYVSAMRGIDEIAFKTILQNTMFLLIIF